MHFNIFGGFQKNEYLLGYDETVDIFGVITKPGLFLGVTPIHFRTFLLRSRYRI